MRDIFKRIMSLLLITCMIVGYIPTLAYSASSGIVGTGGTYSPYIEYQGVNEMKAEKLFCSSLIIFLI